MSAFPIIIIEKTSVPHTVKMQENQILFSPSIFSWIYENAYFLSILRIKTSKQVWHKSLQYSNSLMYHSQI